MITFDQRFWSKVDKSGDCWLWTAGRDGHGYGQIRFGPNNAVMNAHRVSYILTHGEPPKGAFICHTCDTPRCVNPSHLFLGTAKINSEDCARKGRHSKKLTPDQAREIRALVNSGVSRSQVAQTFGISAPTISSIVTGKIWASLDDQSPVPAPLPTADHLPDNQIEEICLLARIGVSWGRLAELYKISQYTISTIVKPQEASA